MSSERAVRLDWEGEGLRFRGVGTEPTSPSIVIDGDGKEGPSPMLTLLMSAAGCSGADVVSIVQKMRLDLHHLTVSVTGVRREEHPRRFVSMHMVFRAEGRGLVRERIEHAVALSVERYCSVIHSLAPDITLTHAVELA